MPTPPPVLGSWKEIARFLGKGVRTAQRWEHELKLPVHRPSKARRGVVIAFPRELEDWAKHQASSDSPEVRHEQVRRMNASSALLIQRTQVLRKNLERVHAECLKAWTSAQRVRKDVIDRSQPPSEAE